MTQIYFDCCSPRQVLLDRRGSEVEDMVEACQHAVGLVHQLVASPGPQDWRDWVVRVSDEDGEEIFQVAFSPLVGKPN
jgi:hypothetical protein